MAAIDDLIEQIEDEILRTRLQSEINRLTKEKKFGLVFEEHLPELAPIYSAKIREGCLVVLRGRSLNNIWRVLSVTDGKASCINRSNGEKQEIPVEELVVVRQFGDPIFPSLIPMDRVQNGPEDDPWHILIEADNYHALQLLEYLYAGQVDCIYIDPPYNTGAKDWKYNNDYVDKNDRWRHSKWLAMMQRRLQLAKRLLNPQTGVLIITIDEHEMHHLRTLLDQIFPKEYKQIITIVINPKGNAQGRFARVDEYAIYTFMEKAFVVGSGDDLLSRDQTPPKKPRWKGLLRSGTEPYREDRESMFYPIVVDPARGAVVSVGDPLPLSEQPDFDLKINGLPVAWPVRSDKRLGRWSISAETCEKLIKKGYVSLGRRDDERNTWGISYISQVLQKQIENGQIKVVSYDEKRNVVDIEYSESRTRAIKTVWHRTRHDAGAYGSDLLTKILGVSRTFAFPKSVYAVADSLRPVLANNPNALVLDFFAGSGTTLHAVNLLNLDSSFNLRCILVTNNEVSEEDANALFTRGYRPGDTVWEEKGICQSVTWPRCKYTIMGKRDDGSELEGEYLTGKIIEKETPRKFHQIGFTTIENLNTVTKKKQLLALIEGIPQSGVKKDSAFIVSEKHSASILFDDSQADAWLEALENQEHITDFYIVTSSSKVFEDLKARINEMLGPIIVTEEEKRPMREGFPVNLEYFKLDFLEKDQVALGRQFREILPLLWLRAGAFGPRPELSEGDPIPDMLIPEHNHFAVLIDETRFSTFLKALEGRSDITHVFIVTDSEEAFQEMAVRVNAPQVIQLYRDYLENFLINKGD